MSDIGESLQISVLGFVEAVLAEFHWLAKDTCATHVLRSAFCLLAGLPIISEKKVDYAVLYAFSNCIGPGPTADCHLPYIPSLPICLPPTVSPSPSGQGIQAPALSGLFSNY